MRAVRCSRSLRPGPHKILEEHSFETALPPQITNVIRIPLPLRATIPAMYLKRLVTHFAYKIEPKPEGGFIARATDPTVPPLEAPTREELQQKIQQNILSALTAEFPALKLPLDGKKLQMSFHVEDTPGGGFSIHSSDPDAAVIHTGDQKELESRFLEKFIGLAGMHLTPEAAKALAAQVGSPEVTIKVNGKSTFHWSSAKGTNFATAANPAPSASTDIPKLVDGNASLAQLEGTIGNNPLTPEPSNAGKIFGVILVLILAALIYFFFLHR